jgi:hypothetical protein
VRGREILDNWAIFRPKFRKVMPVEYRRALIEMGACAWASRPWLPQEVNGCGEPRTIWTAGTGLWAR